VRDLITTAWDIKPMENEKITKENVHKFSRHYKQADRKTRAIALTFLNGVIDYDKEKKIYLVNLSSAHYEIKWDKKFKCNCGFDDCPHILALYMQLKIWNAERQTDKNISAEVID